jgi:hypothetical protein
MLLHKNKFLFLSARVAKPHATGEVPGVAAMPATEAEPRARG